MKQMLRYGIKTIGLLCISVILGVVLLVLAFLLPVQEMKNNVQRSTAIYDYEGVYPQLMAGYKMSQLDNCTDATMLLNAIYPRDINNILHEIMKIYRIEYNDRTPVGSLTDYANDVQADNHVVSYSRYWHGYLVILKPLLLLFDVADIRIFNMVLFGSLLLYIMLLMQRKGMKQYIPLFAVSVILLNPLAIPLSFQFSTVSYIMLLSVIVILKKEDWRFESLFFFFMIIGIATAYFDFLTFPLVGLYFPMIFLLIKKKSWKEAGKIVVFASMAWIIGYGGMWSAKWIVGSVLTGKNLFADALARANNYTNMEYGEGTVSSFQVILKNIMVLVKWPFVIIGAGFLLKAVRHLCKAAKKKCMNWKWGIPFALIIVAPIVWYLAAGTHSYIHYWFTYRELCVSVFALLVGLWKIGEDTENL